MSSTTDLYAPSITPDELLQALDVHRRVLAQPTPAFEVVAAPEPADDDEQRRFWWMAIADTAPDPDGTPIFDQLMFQALAGEL